MSDPISVSTACSQLGIFRYEADKLDALDGNTDGKIKKSIFLTAKEYLDNTTELSDEEELERAKQGNYANFSAYDDVGKCIAGSLSKKMGYNGYVYSSNPDYKNAVVGEDVEDIDDADDENSEIDSGYERMAYLADDVTDQLAGNDDDGNITEDDLNTDGITYEGKLPAGLTNVSMQSEAFSTGASNSVTFDSSGKGNINTVNDAAITVTNYTINGDDYELGLIWGI